MVVRFKIRAHTSVSGPHRWAWMVDMVSTPLGMAIEWSLDEGEANVCEGLDDPQGRHVPDPSPEEMEAFVQQWRKAYCSPGAVWDLGVVYLD